MLNWIEITYFALLFISVLAVIIVLGSLLSLPFIQHQHKRQRFKNLSKISALVGVISFCIGFGLCTYSFDQITSWQ